MIRRRTSGRSGFTLIELLVTITIMAVLASLVLVLVKGFAGASKVAATKSTIRKIDSLLTKRMEAFTRAIAEQDQVAKGAGKAPLYVKAAGMESLYASNPVQATALARKFTFRQQFPQRFSEVSGFTSNPSKHTPDTESAEMLYYMLTSMPAYGTEAPDSDNFSSSEVADTDGDGLKEFVDAWGKPLRFYRWPTRLLRPVLTAGSEGDAQTVDVGSTTTTHDDWAYGHPINLTYDSSGAVANVLLGSLSAAPGVVRGPGTTFGQEHADPLARDPDDPLGSTHPSSRANASTSAQQFERNYHTNDTYHTPLIVSAGVDGALGLYEPNDTAKFGQLAQPNLSELPALLDNITNRNLRAGGE